MSFLIVAKDKSVVRICQTETLPSRVLSLALTVS